MIIHIRTGLPHGHLLNHAADIQVHTNHLTQCVAQLRTAGERLQESLASLQKLRELL